MGVQPPVYIDYQKCTGCRICYNLCPMDVFGWDDEIDMPTVPHAEDCWFEGVCVMECPERCIDIRLPLSNW